MGRITRYPPKPKITYPFAISLDRDVAGQERVQNEAARAGGPAGYKTAKRGWAAVVFSFDTPEKATAFDRWTRRLLHEEELRRMRLRACPVRERYDQAARHQHAVIWGLSTGIIRDVVRTYRIERRDCSTHGAPNWQAAQVVMRHAPTIPVERAREMVDSMLAWVIERHGAWFWAGLQGDRIINRY